jgi:hypothetical protein
MTVIHRRIVNPALGVPRKTPPPSAALEAARLNVCPSCRFYLSKAGEHRCCHVDRQCERLRLRSPSETCPLGAWPSFDL